jgi:ABC-type amino acid transport substrate-binding protein
MPLIRLTSASGLLALTLAAAPALAAPAAAPRLAPPVQAVLDCRAIADNTARLACYDGATSKLGEAEKQGEVVVIDRAQANAAHREMFGFSMPSLDFVNRALKADEVDRVEGVVRSARADSNGRWTVALEDGAVWRQIDGQLMTDPKPGSKVAIRKGSLGSFLMNVDGHTAVKVHRDQ